MFEVSALRLTGMALGLVLLLIASRQVRNRSWPRLQVLIWGAGGAGLLLVAAFPGIASFVFGPFSLAEGEGNPRIVGLLVIAVVFLLLYQSFLGSRLEEGRRELTSLVREMAISRYERERGDAPAPDVLIVIPAYNEEETLADVMTALPDTIAGLRAEALVVVDGARDDTEIVARRFGTPAIHPVNRGQTAALVTGYEIAKLRNARIVATLDADGQMVPDELERLVVPVAEGRADLVNGSRVLGEHEAESQVRSFGVTLFGLLASFLLRRRVTDTSVGMRAIDVEALRRLQLREERFGAAELLVEAQRRRLRIQEVPVTILARAGGETRKPRALRYGAKFASAMIRSWLR